MKPRRHGMGGWSGKRGEGRGIKFLMALLADAPPACVTWPMFRDPNGYGRVGYNGKQRWAHRVMCELANGPAPSEDHEATHSCGNGAKGCVNPRHLSWGTRSRNQLDRRFHGTKSHGRWRGARTKLTQSDVDYIRSQKGLVTQRELAEKFSVTDATIRDIYSGKSWNPASKRSLTVADILEIRKLAEYLRNVEIAAMFDVNETTIWAIVKGDRYADIVEPRPVRVTA